MRTIKILGAGPAGLTAAIVLARAGTPVVVYERGADVGGRHHGDLEAFENWTTDEDVRRRSALTCRGPLRRTGDFTSARREGSKTCWPDLACAWA